MSAVLQHERGKVRLVGRDTGATMEWDLENVSAAIERVDVVSRRTEDQASRQRMAAMRHELTAIGALLRDRSLSPHDLQRKAERRFQIMAVAMDALTEDECSALGMPRTVAGDIRDAIVVTPDDVSRSVRRHKAQMDLIKAIHADTSLSRHQRKLKAAPLLRALRADIQGESDALEAKADCLDLIVDQLAPWLQAMEDGITAERNDCSRLHKLAVAVSTGHCFFVDMEKLGNGIEVKEYGPRVAMGTPWTDLHTFVMDHDWANVFAGATDYEGGEVVLPYEDCAFEWRLNGHTVICLVRLNPTGGLYVLPFVELGDWWFCDGASEQQKGSTIMTAPETSLEQFSVLVRWLGRNVRATLIALDAEVAKHDIVRVPEKLARARAAKGKLPMFDYHVVSLAKRSRAEPGPPSDEPGTRRRLHFVRGHWRHYPSHKVWIKWHLKGDPDLGFVDKEYRL